MSDYTSSGRRQRRPKCRSPRRSPLRSTAAGLAVSLLATRLIRHLLFGIQSADPLVLLLTAAIVTTIAAVACLAPTVQAARIDPMLSLRED
jgi:hypothetical protein